MPLRVGITCHRVPGPCLVLLFSQYACGIKAEVVGKPSPEFFKSALREMGVDASQVGRLLLKRVRRGSCWGRPRVPRVGLGPRDGCGGSVSLGGCGSSPPAPPRRADLTGKGEKDGRRGTLTVFNPSD